mmetsp:Transcript_36984/g.89171  ORF Transcript_36984/g.89171 Transcript_36984/m.89171 type:complete len:145 (-) Transcript_36984:2137-2571(-)
MFRQTVAPSSSSRQLPSTTATKTNAKPSGDSNLAPLLRHFVGIDLIIETKQGRTLRGRLKEADAYMNLVLSRITAQSKGNQSAKLTSEVDASSEQFDWVHIRGPTIRYIVFGANVDIIGVIKAGRDRERAAGDKYKRGVRKARK